MLQEQAIPPNQPSHALQRIRENSSKWQRLIILLVFVFVSAIISSSIVFFITESVFFDKIFFQKSCLHGYQNSQSWLCWGRLQDSVRQRLNDSELVFSGTFQPKTDEVTIALLGDSFVYGLGVRDNQRFGQILEKQLDQIAPTRVLNLAKQSDHIVDTMAKYEYLKNHYDIDLYIVTVLSNDLYIDSFDRYENSKQIYEEFAKQCPQPRYDTPNYGNNPESYLYQLSPEYNNHCLYRESMKLLAQSDTPVEIFLYNVEPQSEKQVSTYSEFFKSYDINQYKDQAYDIINRFFAEEARAQSLPVIDISNINAYYWESVSELEWHPSASAHQLFAESLFHELSGSELYQIPKKQW